MSLLRPFSSRSTPPPVAIPGPVTAVVDTPPAPRPPAHATPPPQMNPSLAPQRPTLQPNPTPPYLTPPRLTPPNLDPPLPEPESEAAVSRWRRWFFPSFAGLLLLLLGGIIAGWFTTRTETTSPDQVNDAIGEAFSSTTIPGPAGPAIYSTVLPSLAFIQSGEPNTEGSSIGSGVVINADGNIMTSNHVVDGATQILITFADGTESAAQIIQADPAIDIAILQVQTLPEVVVPAVLGGGVRIGDPVYALGNPLGLGGSFSAGVVSGLDRTLPLPDGSELGQLIQFDAAVNPGSSGGPLVDRGGQVVGIVTAIANPTGEDFFSGIGFAVPIATAGGAAGGPEQ